MVPDQWSSFPRHEGERTEATLLSQRTGFRRQWVTPSGAYQMIQGE